MLMLETPFVWINELLFFHHSLRQVMEYLWFVLINSYKKFPDYIWIRLHLLTSLQVPDLWSLGGSAVDAGGLQS